MTRSTSLLCALASVLWIAAVGAAGRPALQSRAVAGRVDFDGQIQPIIESHCLECHSAEKRKGGLSLATYGDALDGGRNGAVIRPGNGTASLIVQRLLGRVDPQMPKDEDPLPSATIALIRRWIDEGARETPTGPPAPAPWDAPLALTRPTVPAVVWSGWSAPADRFIAAYLSDRGSSEPATVDEARFARRAYLDIWGLLPSPDALAAFLKDTDEAKRERLVRTLLSDNEKYAEHWISFWNDLLRNEDGVTYYSETAARKSITNWLLASLVANVPYDRFVTKLVNPQSPGDPDGFLVGVNWRGETSAAVTPWMQASQNTAQVFLGVNLKCNACHDSFVSHWKLKDAYALAGYFSPDPKLQLYRCDRALDQFVSPAFLYPSLTRNPPSTSLDDRRATLAAIFTDPRNGRLPRTLVNRVWQRLFGYGLVSNPDDMDVKPWNAALLDWLAADFVSHGYDVKHLLLTIMSSRAYQLPATARHDEPRARDYVFSGPEVRRLTAEEFADAIGLITGEWSVYPAPDAPGGVYRPSVASRARQPVACAGPSDSRPGHDHTRLQCDDPSRTRAREWCDPDEAPGARSAAPSRRAAARTGEPVQQGGRGSCGGSRAVRRRCGQRLEAVAGRAGERLVGAGTDRGRVGQRRASGTHGIDQGDLIDACGDLRRATRVASDRLDRLAGGHDRRRTCVVPVPRGLRHRRQGLHSLSRNRRGSRTPTSGPRFSHRSGSSSSIRPRIWIGSSRRSSSAPCPRSRS